MMSPNVKKILMIGGAAVAGFVIYKMIKKPAQAAAPVAMTMQRSALLSQIKGAQFSKMAGAEEDLGVSEDLGPSEDMGSLGGGWR